MTTSSADPVVLATAPDLLRPARLDRPLGATSLGRYADPELEQIVLAAADEARQRACAEGYAAGWALGCRNAAADQAERAAAVDAAAARQRTDVATRAQTLLAALAAAARRGQDEAVPQWHEVADVLADGAIRLARAALDRELATVDSVVVESVRRALRALADPASVAVHVHPDDVALLTAADLPAGVRVVGDPAVAPGDARAWTPTQRLQASLPTALASAEEVLRR